MHVRQKYNYILKYFVSNHAMAFLNVNFCYQTKLLYKLFTLNKNL